MAGLSPKDSRVPGLSPVSGIVTDSPVAEFGVTADGQFHLRIDLEVSGVTVAGSITAKLQHRSPGGAYEDCVGANATAAITADGTASITQLIERAADVPNMPLRKQVRVVLTTTAGGDEVTVDKAWVQQVL